MPPAVQLSAKLSFLEHKREKKKREKSVNVSQRLSEQLKPIFAQMYFSQALLRWTALRTIAVFILLALSLSIDHKLSKSIYSNEDRGFYFAEP